MVQGVNGWRRCWMALLSSFLCVSLAFGAASESSPSPASDTRPLILGILPFISPIALFKRYAPLRDYLTQQTGRPVLLETARNYPEFVRRTAKRRYDIVVTAPHFVISALRDGAYKLQATYTQRLSAVILVSAHGDIRDPAELAGLHVATPPRQAIVTLIGSDLIEHATRSGAAPEFRAYQSHNAAYSAVAAGEVSAAVVTVSVVDPHTLAKDGLRELTRSESFPAMGILMASDLSPTLREQLTAALVGMTDNAAGRSALERISWSGCRRAGDHDFEAMRPYVGRVKRLLEAGS